MSQFLSNSTLEEFNNASVIERAKSAGQIANEIRSIMITYSYPVIILLGLTCNLLSFIVLTRSNMRQNPTSICFALLSIVDSFILIVSALPFWITEIFRYRILLQSEFLCKFVTYLAFSVTCYSVWIICVVTLERFIAVIFPLKIQKFCTRRRSIYILVISGVITFLINLPLYFNASIMNIGGGILLCSIAWNTHFWRIFTWIDTVVRFLLPFTILIICNYKIVMATRLATKERSNISVQLSATRNSEATNNSDSKTGSNDLLRMVLSVNLYFFFSYLPFSIWMLVDGYLEIIKTSFMQGNISDFLVFQLMFQISVTLVYSYHACNFFMYLASGRKFRKTFFNYFCCSGNRPLAYKSTSVARPQGHVSSTRY